MLRYIVEALLYRGPYRARLPRSMRLECFLVADEREQSKKRCEYRYWYDGKPYGAAALWRLLGADKSMSASTFKSRLFGLYSKKLSDEDLELSEEEDFCEIKVTVEHAARLLKAVKPIKKRYGP
ncbi:MAG: hypothetical protein L0Z53_06050 [Acidobacteriales bacterium]|nr:hypothetical protein [Terriglobales bacterium]